MKTQCDYKKCKAVPDIETKMGVYCGYHYKTMRKKFPKLEGKEINMSKNTKKLIKQTRNIKNFTIKLQGGIK